MYNTIFSQSINSLDILTEAQKTGVIGAFSSLFEDAEASAPSSSSSSGEAAPTKASSTAPDESEQSIEDVLPLTVNDTPCGVIKKRSVAPQYIVLHYTAGVSSKTGKASAVADMFADSDKSSADFIVDDGSIWQFNPDPSVYQCAAVGVKDSDFKAYMNDPGATNPGPATMKGTITNGNSISIEMCSNIDTPDNEKNINNPKYKGWFFTPEVLDLTKKLVAYLLVKYEIPEDNIYIHYDVTGKRCPAMWSWDNEAYSEFLQFKTECQNEPAPDVKELEGKCKKVNMGDSATYKNQPWYNNADYDYDISQLNKMKKDAKKNLEKLTQGVVSAISGAPGDVLVKVLSTKFGQQALPVIKEFVGSFVKSGGLKNVVK